MEALAPRRRAGPPGAATRATGHGTEAEAEGREGEGGRGGEAGRAGGVEAEQGEDAEEEANGEIDTSGY